MLPTFASTSKARVRSALFLRTRSPWHNVHRCCAYPAHNHGAWQSHGQRTKTTYAHQNGVFLGTVESRTPQNTSIEQLLAQIQPWPAGPATRPNDINSILTVFLTPAFAQHALDTNLPIHVMQRFSELGVVSKPLDAVVAVVDRLPAPKCASAGVEGLAYAFLSNPNAPLPVSSQIPLNMSAQKPGSLSFAMRLVQRSYTTQLPLAQTTFTNGLPSTLIHTHYDFVVATGSLHEISTKRLESQMLPIPFDNAKQRLKYAMPFIPLTPFRKVMSSMGNIVRKLSPHSFAQEEHFGLDPEYEPEPSSFLSASQELETAVSNYFELLDIPPRSVQVWALILPNTKRWSLTAGKELPPALLDIDRQVLEALWTDPHWEGRWHVRILDLIDKGCRLARVLSGGGGWGKKAGLLSLDPDTGYSTRDLRRDQGWEFQFADEYTDEAVADQQRQALGEIVKPGEHVMFFLAPETPHASLFDDMRYKDGSDRSVTFGVIPSSIDEVVETAPRDTERSEHVSFTDHHHRDTFGMLSEGGMAVTRMHGHQYEIQTKMDIPFGDLTITSLDEVSFDRYLRGLLEAMDDNSKTLQLSREDRASSDPKQ